MKANQNNLIKLFLVGFIFVSVISCNKTLNDIDTFTKVEKLAIKEVLNMPNVENQRTAFTLLSPKQKVEVWKIHLNQCLDSDKFSDEQKKLIKEAKNTISEGTFTNSTDYFNKKANIVLFFKIKQTFSQNLKKLVFSSLTNPSYFRKESEPPITMIGSNNCDCNLQDDWCWGDQICKKVGCARVASNCGWWWSEDCNGLCLGKTIIIQDP